jgi:Malonyl-CoA decarboxylase N-terminal domain/Malonyl-CoA decarboxylase C-terminal domain
VDAAIEAYAARAGDREAARLFLALNSPRLLLFRCFNTISESLRFLVRLRADLNDRPRTNPNLWILEFELRHLLESWFNPGFLQLWRLTWESPAALLENIDATQAVHQFSDWQDLKRPRRAAVRGRRGAEALEVSPPAVQTTELQGRRLATIAYTHIQGRTGSNRASRVTKGL